MISEANCSGFISLLYLTKITSSLGKSLCIVVVDGICEGRTDNLEINTSELKEQFLKP